MIPAPPLEFKKTGYFFDTIAITRPPNTNFIKPRSEHIGSFFRIGREWRFVPIKPRGDFISLSASELKQLSRALTLFRKEYKSWITLHKGSK